MSPDALPVPSPRRLWALRGMVLAMVLALVSILALAAPPQLRQGDAAPGERLTHAGLVAALAVIERQLPALPRAPDPDPGPVPAPVLPERAAPGTVTHVGPDDVRHAQAGDPSRRPRAPPAHPA